MLISCPRLPENHLGARLFVRNFTHCQKEQVTLPYRAANSPRAEAAARDLAEYLRHADKTFEEAAQ